MTLPPREAIDAVLKAAQSRCKCGPDPWHEYDCTLQLDRGIAQALLEAAEAVWPHKAPQRDPASTTATTTALATPASTSGRRREVAPVRAFGFSQEGRS